MLSIKHTTKSNGCKTIARFQAISKFVLCSFVLENFGSDNIAIYTQMDDPSKNNINDILQSGEEAAVFQPETVGKYYVVVNMDQSQIAPETATESEAETAQPASRKIKRVQ